MSPVLWISLWPVIIMKLIYIREGLDRAHFIRERKNTPYVPRRSTSHPRPVPALSHAHIAAVVPTGSSRNPRGASITPIRHISRQTECIPLATGTYAAANVTLQEQALVDHCLVQT